MDKLGLNQNARTVLEKRYLLRDPDGALAETPTQLFERVANAVAAPEGRRGNERAVRFLELMTSLRFLPNSPTLMNAGKKDGQLAACFVLPVEDSLESIFDTLKAAALIHQSGGGTGFSFSRLRAAGSPVKSTHGTASGPVSFIKIFDVSTEAIKQGGTRRGANMAVLRVDHPDILEFIESKRDLKSITNFNISVGVTDEFMSAVAADGEFAFRDPESRRPAGSISARALLEKITASAWECGDPGFVFLDRIGFFNPTPKVGEMESTNPCGEQPLLPFESCNLGSLNLGAYFDGKGFDWAKFGEDTRLATRFLDNVIEVNHYPVKESARITLRNRKIGLGVMGFADLLLLLGVPYESPEAVVWGEKIMGVMDREAKRESMALAKERGAFANWKGSLWDRLGYPPMRNATVTTVAPTGTISLIAGASGGIEPIFSAVFYRNVLQGARLLDVHPAAARVLRARGVRDPETLGEAEIERALGPAWSPAHRVSVAQHIRIQAAFQRHSDSAVSKTINLPHSATQDDVREAYLYAYASGCKGITVYRDRSRPVQVLEKLSCPEC